jgi:hypothetical protein
MTVSAPAESPQMLLRGVEKKNIARLVVAISVGNALEWYDITVYGYFAAYISQAFFPNDDHRLHWRSRAGVLPDLGLRPQPGYPDHYPNDFRRLARGVTEWRRRRPPPKASCDGRTFGP